jgi:alanine-glyoxylate transaminase / serine-glyoxylate transaminase / serine-pyruvate transaminase
VCTCCLLPAVVATTCVHTCMHRYMFQTSSPYTLMVSGTGHAGMEAAVANLLEPGEKIIVGVNGIWGERVADLAERYGGA